MEYTRLPNETDEELLWRLGQLKDEIGTWDQFAKVMNDLTGNDFGESTWRKRLAGMRKVVNTIPKQTEKSYEDDISIKIRDLEKQRKKLQTEKIEYNKWLREEARDEMIMEEICNSISKLNPLEMPSKLSVEHGSKSYLLTIADCHYGIDFCIKDLFGNTLNEYSPEIFEQRMWQLFSMVVEKIESENIKELNIWELGDGIQGIIRLNSQLMKLRYGIIDSSIRYAYFLANWINELSKLVRIKFQMVMDSNHNQLRICGAPKNAFSEENMSKVMLTILKLVLKDNPNVTIIENVTGMNYGIFSSYSVLGIHGEVKNLGKSLNDFSRSYQMQIDYVIGAHKHHLENKEVGIDAEALSVRSIIGVDPYGLSLNATSNAGASIFVFEQGFGRTAEYCFKLN